jgi:hypothetical protein
MSLSNSLIFFAITLLLFNGCVSSSDSRDANDSAIGYNETAGWNVIDPIYETLSYLDNNLTVSFINTAGIPIQIENVSIWENTTKSECNVIEPSKGTFVNKKSVFNLIAFCPYKNRTDGYKAVITIIYMITNNGVTTGYSEKETLERRTYREPPGCQGFSQVKLIDWEASTADYGNLTLTLINDAGTKIKIMSVNATIFNNQLCNWPGQAQDMRSGELIPLSIANCFSTGSPDTGEYYKADIIIAYQNVASGISHTSAGECHGYVA